MGVSHKVGNLISYWVLTILSNVVSCTTVTRVTSFEKNNDEYKTRVDEHTKHVNKALTAQNTDLFNIWSAIPQWNRLSLDEDGKVFEEELKKVIDNDNVPHVDTV